MYCSNGGVVPVSQINGLEYFYNSTNGDSWSWSTDPVLGIPWNFSAINTNKSNPCISNWQGIECTANCSSVDVLTCDILSVSLENYNITGRLPSQFLSLNTQLEVLVLSTNNLFGHVPSEIGSLYGLDTLNLQKNYFDGSILSYFGSMSVLRIINLAYNQFTGTIPANMFAQLNQSLEYFGNVHNPFSGSVPDNIGTLKAATLIRIGFNEQTGTIPTSVCDVSTLEFLSISINDYSGSLPTDIGKLTKLTFLALGGYDLITGPLPSGINNLTKMKFLYLAGAMTGTLPSLAALNAVTALVISNSYMVMPPAVLLDLAQKPLLHNLVLRDNFFTGDFAGAQFSPSLQVLQLSNNLFTGTALLSQPSLCLLTRLTIFSIDGNSFSGSLPSCMDAWSSLEILLLNNNRLSSTLPSALLQYPHLKQLLIQTNHFSGQISTALGHYTALDTLVFSDNMFTGSLPMQTLNSTSLLLLVASKNCFTGTLTSSICNAVNLQTLSLSGLAAATHCPHNHKALVKSIDIGGSFPSCLFHMPQLVQLYAAGNGIRGKLSPVSSTSRLQNISMSYNRISGTIPLSLQQNSQLELIDLSFNRLLGTMEQMTDYVLTTTATDSPATTDTTLATDAALGDQAVVVRSITIAKAQGQLMTPMSAATASSDPAVAIPSESTFVLVESSETPAAAVVMMAYTPETSVILHTNHLSGSIPSEFTHATSEINVLSGNMFECPSFSTLPQADPKSHKYSCGSQVLDLCLLMCVIAIAVAPFYAGWAFRSYLRFGTLSKGVVMTNTESVGVCDRLISCWKQCAYVWVGCSTLLRFLFHTQGAAVIEWGDGEKHQVRDVGVVGSVSAVVDKYHTDAAVCGQSAQSPGVQPAQDQDENKDKDHQPHADTTDVQTLLTRRQQEVENKCRGVINYAAGVLSQFRRMFALLATLILILFLPTNSLLKTITKEFSSQTHQYGWVVSVAFLDGVAPGILIAIFWLVVIAFSVGYEYRTVDRAQHRFHVHSTDIRASEPSAPTTTAIGKHGDTSISERASTTLSQLRPPAQQVQANKDYFYMQLLVVFVNILISLLVNGAYVYVMITQSFGMQILAIAFVSVFKLLWTPLVVIPWLKRVEGKFVMVVIANICNIIVVPMLSVMAVDLSCFQSSFSPQPPIVTEFEFNLCVSWDAFDKTKCAVYENKLISIETAAPIIYNNQCFAAVLTSYIPSFIVTFGVIGICVPCIQMLFLSYFALCSTPMADTMNAINRNRQERKHQLMRRIKKLGVSVMNRLLPIESMDDLLEEPRQPATAAVAVEAVNRIRAWSKTFELNTIVDVSSSSETCRDVKVETGGVEGVPAVSGENTIYNDDKQKSPESEQRKDVQQQSPRRQNLYFSRYVCMNCNLMLTLLMTFGVAFPPFAIILLINVCVSTLAFQLTIMHHYTQIRHLPIEVQEVWLLALIDEVHLLHKILFGSRTAILLFSCMFAMFVLYDTMSMESPGLAIGFMVMVFVLTLTLNRVTKYFRKNRAGSGTSSSFSSRSSVGTAAAAAAARGDGLNTVASDAKVPARTSASIEMHAVAGHSNSSSSGSISNSCSDVNRGGASSGINDTGSGNNKSKPEVVLNPMFECDGGYDVEEEETDDDGVDDIML